MANIRDLRLHHLRLCRSGVEQELIHLVRADVAQNPAVLIRIPEPGGPSPAATGVSCMLDDLMRRDVDGLDHFSDCALPHEHARIDRSFHLQQLAIEDGVDALGFDDGPAHLRQLLERRYPRLVGEEIFAALHGAHGDPGTLARDLRGENQLHRRIVENFVLRGDDLYIGKPLAEQRQLVFFAAPRRRQFAAAALDGADHAVDVVVAHAANGKLDVVFGSLLGLRGYDGVLHDARCSAAEGDRSFGQPGHHRRRTQRSHQTCLLQEFAPVCETRCHFSSALRLDESVTYFSPRRIQPAHSPDCIAPQRFRAGLRSSGRPSAPARSPGSPYSGFARHSSSWHRACVCR